MTDLFISYSRRDLEFVQRLYNELKSRDRDIWIDLEDIPPTAAWLAEIYAGIENANAFVFVISPDSAVSEVCRLEIEYAVKHSKKLVPILHREVEERARLHSSLASHNWLFFRENDDFERAFRLLNEALDTDLDHVRAHTRLLVRALEWDNRQRDNSFILRGTDLVEAETWLAASMDKTPEPTQLHTQYIFASRQAETARQRVLLIAVTSALIIAVALAVIAFIQWREADAARQQASSAQGTAVAALISVNDTRATAQAQEDTFRATIRALGQEARAEVAALDAEDAPVPAPPTTQIAQALPTQTAVIYSPDEDNDITPGGLDMSTSLPDTGGGIDPGAALLVSVADYQLADTDAEHIQAQNALVGLVQINPNAARRMLTGHNGPVQSVAYNPAGSLLASGGDDNTVIVWDSISWARVGLPFYGHNASVTDVAWSPDGTIIASSSRDGTVILWDVAAGSAVRQLSDRSTNWVLSLAYSPEGTTLLSSGSDPVVKAWDTRTGQITRTYEGLSGTTYAVAYSPDGRRVAAGDSYGLVIVWDAASGAEISRLAAHQGAVFTLAYSPDGRTLASGGADSLALLWDATSGELLHTLTGAANVILSVAYSPDSAILAVGTAENVVRLYDVASGQLIGDAYRGYGDWVYSVAYHPAGQYLASGSSDGSIVVWPVGIEQWLREACTLAGRTLTSEEWAQFFPGQPYQDVCPPR